MRSGRDGEQISQTADRKESEQVTFSNDPTAEDLRPTERHIRVLKELSEWQDRSAKTPWVLGEPLGK